MPAPRSLLALLVAAVLAAHGEALRCHKCVAANENECGKQGSHSCPPYADACATITAPNSVVKSCSYKSFCEQARGTAAGGASVRCCFGDDCNGPPRGARSAGSRAPPPGPVPLAAAPLLLLLPPLLPLPRAP